MSKDYFYPIPQGAYSYNTVIQIQQAIGRKPQMSCHVGNQLCLRFAIDLTTEEEQLVSAIYNTPETAGDIPVPAHNDAFRITDLWDSTFKADLGVALGCEVVVYFGKSQPDLEKTDIIEVHFSKALSVQEKKTAENAMKALIIGWV